MRSNPPHHAVCLCQANTALQWLSARPPRCCASLHADASDTAAYADDHQFFIPVSLTALHGTFLRTTDPLPMLGNVAHDAQAQQSLTSLPPQYFSQSLVVSCSLFGKLPITSLQGSASESLTAAWAASGASTGVDVGQRNVGHVTPPCAPAMRKIPVRVGVVPRADYTQKCMQPTSLLP